MLPVHPPRAASVLDLEAHALALRKAPMPPFRRSRSPTDIRTAFGGRCRPSQSCHVASQSCCPAFSSPIVPPSSCSADLPTRPAFSLSLRLVARSAFAHFCFFFFVRPGLWSCAQPTRSSSCLLFFLRSVSLISFCFELLYAMLLVLVSTTSWQLIACC
jgi:hypothetical protein